MSTLRGKLFDRNRYAKRYPMVRAPKRMTYMGDAHLAIELGSIYLENADTGTLTYEVPFLDTEYQTVATLRDTGTESDGGVNTVVWVSAVHANSVTIMTSTNITGYVDIFSIKVG